MLSKQRTGMSRGYASDVVMPPGLLVEMKRLFHVSLIIVRADFPSLPFILNLKLSHVCFHASTFSAVLLSKSLSLSYLPLGSLHNGNLVRLTKNSTAKNIALDLRLGAYMDLLQQTQYLPSKCFPC